MYLDAFQFLRPRPRENEPIIGKSVPITRFVAEYRDLTEFEEYLG
jgi:hypothetical protein